MSVIDTPAALLQQLMSDRAPDRVHALHALERRMASVPPALAHELEAFVARGIPFYAPDDRAYQAWVARAVALWQRAQAAPAAVPRMKARSKAAALA